MPGFWKIGVVVASIVFGFASSALAQYRVEVDPVGTAEDCKQTCGGQSPCTYGVYCPSRDPRYGPRCILTDQRPRFFTKKCAIWDKHQGRYLTAADYATNPPPPPPVVGPMPGLSGVNVVVAPYEANVNCSKPGWKRPVWIGIAPVNAACPNGWIRKGKGATASGASYRHCAYCGTGYRSQLKYSRCCVAK